MNKLKILYFGFYKPAYGKNRVLIKGFQENGVSIVQCRVSGGGFFQLLKLFFEYFRIKPKYDIMVVGFPGQEVMSLARLLTFRLFSRQTRKPIILDILTSHYGGYILDRQYFNKNSWRAKYYRWADILACKLADLVLLDTNAHIEFFVKEFGLPREKFLRVFVGTDDEIMKPMEILKDTDKFLVHFHGHFIPLQGTEYIIEAANILRNEPILFQTIGKGQDYAKSRARADELKLDNIRWIDEVSYEELARRINMADICLGGFGTTEKTKHVSMNKLFEYMACGKPIITGDGPPAREIFTDYEDGLLCKRGNPQDLADKIMILLKDTGLRQKLGRNARKEFETRFTPKILVKDLLLNLEKLKYV